MKSKNVFNIQKVCLKKKVLFGKKIKSVFNSLKNLKIKTRFYKNLKIKLLPKTIFDLKTIFQNTISNRLSISNFGIKD
jgi:hypothetical protein